MTDRKTQKKCRLCHKAFRTRVDSKEKCPQCVRVMNYSELNRNILLARILVELEDRK